MLINLDAFSTRDLQNCAALLTECEAAGITDIAAAKVHLLSTLASPVVARPQPVPDMICPDCGSPLLPAATIDGLRRIGCRKCYYSRPVDSRGEVR